MQQPMGFQLRLGWSGWLALLIAFGCLLAVAAALAVFLLAVFVIVLPVALVAALLYYLFPGLRHRSPGWKGEAEIIEGNYRVVVPQQLDRPRDEES
jgi:hypothetical protein